jgi:hypothetical protein
VVNATNGWLESLERSLAMMKEYQVSADHVWNEFPTNFQRLRERSLKTVD